MAKNPLIERWRFWLDCQLSKGTSVLLLLLLATVITSLVIVTIAIIVVGAVPNNDMTVIDTMWTVFAYMYDPTSVSYKEGVWAYRVLLLIASLVGVVVLSTLIGIITTSFDSLIEKLRKGKSPVILTGHTILLGWSDQIFILLNELIIANEYHPDNAVVILADKDKVEMEDEIRARISNRNSTRIICRSGSPIDRTDLEIVRPQASRSIIITPSDTGENLDSMVIKCMLAILKTPRTDDQLYNIVTSIKEERNRSAANILGGSQAHLVPADQIVAQIIAQTCRQPGLSQVYSEMLDFEGEELYFVDGQDFVGRIFGDILLSFSSSTVIGLKRAAGDVVLNPPMDEVVTDGSSIIVMSHDEKSTVTTTHEFNIDFAAISTSRSVQSSEENFLILGWNKIGELILRELDQYVMKRTVVTIVSGAELTEDLHVFQSGFSNLNVSVLIADHTDRVVLGGVSNSDRSSIVILADKQVSMQEADAKTLMTLIHLRDIKSKLNHKINIVTEMLDDRNRELADLSGDSDFIVSNKIIALMLTQISENRDLYDVYSELFDAKGNELYLKPIIDYVVPARPLTFATVIKSAAARGQIAIGYKKDTGAESAVFLNIDKGETIVFSETDQVIVISEE
ncbi:MAG: hypothetical protein HYX66_05705 [Ignavibacteria bacterium]|nr:hypothetical protein [Ignavibacteria bacterium]